jgi:predicted ATPase
VLIREVAYRTLLRAERKEAHASIARFLEEATPNREEVASALGYHWREAGDDDLAIKYFLIAADQAGRGWAKERATALYRDALELIPETHADMRREISRKRALMAAASVHIRDAEVLRARHQDSGETG